ncbi:MAG TPA: hypothetical protein IAC71_00685 [Candidatus Caccomonas pullistercoris]|nr:hypothetical protein [Candidatus Caccomonas pullistercoris]
MASLDDELLQDAEDDARAVAFIQQQLPQELKEKFSEEQLYYFLDLIADYYATSGVLDATPDKDGYVDVDIEKMATELSKQAAKEKMGVFTPEEISFVIEAEMDFAEGE